MDEFDDLVKSVGGVYVDPERVEEVWSSHGSGPVQMVNLLKFRARAAYPDEYDGPDSRDCSGRQAYERYAAGAMDAVAAHGGRLVLLSKVDGVYFGRTAHDEWDVIAIIEYPSVEAVDALTDDPDHVKLMVHRHAALERWEIFATTPLTTS